MAHPLLSAGTHVIVADGKKAFVLFNEGTAEHPSLTVETHLNHADPQARALGVARPGRVFASLGRRRAATAETDGHQKAEDQFIHDVMAHLVDLARREKLRKLVLIAPPRAMAVLRRALPDSFSALVTAEITKDFTNHSVSAITSALRAQEARL